MSNEKFIDMSKGAQYTYLVSKWCYKCNQHFDLKLEWATGVPDGPFVCPYCGFKRAGTSP